MSSQTSTGQVEDSANGVDETRLTPELIDRVLNLAPAERENLRDMLSGEADEPEGTPEELRVAWREEIRRRLDAIDRGDMELFTPEEVIARVQSRREVRADS